MERRPRLYDQRWALYLLSRIGAWAKGSTCMGGSWTGGLVPPQRDGHAPSAPGCVIESSPRSLLTVSCLDPSWAWPAPEVWFEGRRTGFLRICKQSWRVARRIELEPQLRRSSPGHDQTTKGARLLTWHQPLACPLRRNLSSTAKAAPIRSSCLHESVARSSASVGTALVHP